MNVSVITGSRADYGHLQWPLKLLREDSFFSVAEVRIWGLSAPDAMSVVAKYLDDAKPHLVMLLGDRFEIMAAAMAAHLFRVPIAHLCGGDVTEGSYDDAMRDCISRMATLHFPSNFKAAQRLLAMGYHHVHNVGATTHDFIVHGDWKRERPIADPYVVVNYQAETIDGTVDLKAVESAIGERKAVWITPNPDRGNDAIPTGTSFDHDQYLNLLAHCEELIGNSSSAYYEAPMLGVNTTIIGKRQRGRSALPAGDGHASDRIIAILKKWMPSA